MSQKNLHILFAGGGTGGHLFPGLAAAETLTRRAPGAKIGFCGTGKPWERAQVSEAGYDYHPLAAAPLVLSPLGVLRAVFSNGVGYRASRRLLADALPDLVVGLGGYGSVPLGLAAGRVGIPLLLLEQNAVPGRANRLLARWATAVCTAFEGNENEFPPQANLFRTGNPLRAVILDRAREQARSPLLVKSARPLLLVLGGSQGAHSLNVCIAEALPKLATRLRDWDVIHQAGPKDVPWLRDAYAKAKLHADVEPFIRDIADVYGRATLAIARAGATTLAELSVMGIPAVLFPYPMATGNHQWHNAQAFGRAGAAVVVEDRPESGRSVASLTASLLPLIKLPELREEMRRAMLSLAPPDAANAVVSKILAIVEAHRLALLSA